MNEQIEEMYKIFLEYKFTTAIEKFSYEGMCEHFYNAGYRKIPENAVVLTGTETEERLVDLIVEFDEMSFFPATLTPDPEECAKEWKRKLIYTIGRLNKETAERFAERLKQELKERDICGWIEDRPLEYWEEDVDEICKEITEGKV